MRGEDQGAGETGVAGTLHQPYGYRPPHLGQRLELVGMPNCQKNGLSRVNPQLDAGPRCPAWSRRRLTVFTAQVFNRPITAAVRT